MNWSENMRENKMMRNLFIKLKFIFLLLFILNMVFHQAEAGLGTPSLSVSITSPSQIERGESASIAVTISETAGQDWAKDVSATVTISPSDGVVLDSQTKSVSRIDRSASKTLYFTLSTSKTASVGARSIKVNVAYYDTGWLDADVFGPHYAAASTTLTLKESHGTIEVSSDSNGADIYIDGNYIGITPKTISEVLAGLHTIVLKKSGYHEISKTIDVKPGQTSYISETLILQTGTISVSSNPVGAEVYLDGNYKGTTPITIPNIPIGAYTVVLKKSGYHEVSKTIDVKSDQTTYISETLTLQTGSIKISSDPIGAEVYFDGAYKGVTPITISNVPIGAHTIVLKKFGYAEWSQSVNIQVDRTIEVNHSMELFIMTGFAPMGLLIVGLVILLVLGIVWSRKRKIKPDVEFTEEPEGEFQAELVEKPQEPDIEKPIDKSTNVAEEPVFDKKSVLKDINITSAFGYKGATILYKVKVENTSPAPIADIKVSLFVPNVFLLLEKEKSFALLKPGESKTVTFEIRPTGECGDCEVSGKVAYYDTASNRTKENDMESKMLSIVCPMLKVKEISDSDWHNTVNNLLKTEESTNEIDMSADTLFNMASRIIKDMNMHMLKPEVTQDQKIFNGVARFYCEGIKGLHYAAQIEVVGGARKSKLILKAWAEKEDALTGFYHGVLDEIEKRVKVKEYIDDSIVQYNVHIGDKIGTLVKDSVVQRSSIGAGVRKCPDCGREIEANEKFCLECGLKSDLR